MRPRSPILGRLLLTFALVAGIGAMHTMIASAMDEPTADTAITDDVAHHATATTTPTTGTTPTTTALVSHGPATVQPTISPAMTHGAMHACLFLIGGIALTLLLGVARESLFAPIRPSTPCPTGANAPPRRINRILTLQVLRI